jgi:hypothetical protein
MAWLFVDPGRRSTDEGHQRTDAGSRPWPLQLTFPSPMPVAHFEGGSKLKRRRATDCALRYAPLAFRAFE